MLYKLVYLSEESFKFTEPTLDEILQISRKNNFKYEITGLLIYSKGTILQFLEGEESHVKHLYKKIEADNRHKNLKVIISGDSVERYFPEWLMGFKLVEDNVYSNYLKHYNILERTEFKDFIFNNQKPVETIIDLVSGKYDFV